MQNEMMIFEGNEVEVLEVAGQVLFNPKHVADCLEIADVNSSIRNFNEKQVVKVKNSDLHNLHIRKMNNAGENFLTESGVYKLVFKSHKPNAEKFTDWIADEVLPSIRKNGGYIANQESLSDEELMAKAVLVAQNTIAAKDRVIEQQNERIDEMRPKEIFADAVATSNTSILVGDLAKMLKQNGVDIGQNRLFAWLRENGYLIKRAGADWNMPTQRSMDMGLFEVKESTVNNPDGSVRINKTTKVTGKGQQYFINKFLGEVA